MSRGIILIILGALVALTPFSGLPLAILTYVLPPLGLLVLAIGLSLRMRQGRREP